MTGGIRFFWTDASFRLEAVIEKRQVMLFFRNDKAADVRLIASHER